jgi:DNA invertase Pin-like site-specific DNA recombinase
MKSHEAEPRSERRPPGRPRSVRARLDILKAAYRLLKARGFRAIGSQELAQGAGVSSATLYRWRKEEILWPIILSVVAGPRAFRKEICRTHF